MFIINEKLNKPYVFINLYFYNFNCKSDVIQYLLYNITFAIFIILIKF